MALVAGFRTMANTRERGGSVKPSVRDQDGTGRAPLACPLSQFWFEAGFHKTGRIGPLGQTNRSLGLCPPLLR